MVNTNLRLLRLGHLWGLRWWGAGLRTAAHVESGQALAHVHEAMVEHRVGNHREPGPNQRLVQVGGAVEQRRRRRGRMASGGGRIVRAGGRRSGHRPLFATAVVATIRHVVVHVLVEILFVLVIIVVQTGARNDGLLLVRWLFLDHHYLFETDFKSFFFY